MQPKNSQEVNYSDTLKNKYAAMGLASDFFEGNSPVDLWRMQHPTNYKKKEPMMTPSPARSKLIDGKMVEVRRADVKTEIRDGIEFVLGCRCKGQDYRGLSLSDKPLKFGGTFHAFLIAKGTQLPASLMLTRDHQFHGENAGTTHYTLGPKDDMPYALFLQHLIGFGAQAVEYAKATAGK